MLPEEALFTQFGLQMIKLEEEKRGSKGPIGEFLKLRPYHNLKHVFFWLYLDYTVSKLSNDTKITKNRGRIKTLWPKENKGAKIEGATKNHSPAKISQ